MNDRKSLIKLIHVAKRDLKMDNDNYALLLMSAAESKPGRMDGKKTTKEMNVDELERVMKALRAKGFKVRHTTPHDKGGKGGVSRPLDTSPKASKIRAQWLELHELGFIKNPDETALAQWVKAQTGLDALQFCNDEQLSCMIERLKNWKIRSLSSGTFYCQECHVTYKNMSRQSVLSFPTLVCSFCDPVQMLKWRPGNA